MTKEERIKLLTQNVQDYIELLNQSLNDLQKELQNENE